MTVKELITKLREFDQEMLVVVPGRYWFHKFFPIHTMQADIGFPESDDVLEENWPGPEDNIATVLVIGEDEHE
jgi:hypothetical protein